MLKDDTDAQLCSKKLFPGRHAQMEAIRPEIQAKECIILLSAKSCPLLPTVIQTITFFAPEKDFSKYSFNILKLRFQQFWFFLSKC